jgi:hypothetical protein
VYRYQPSLAIHAKAVTLKLEERKRTSLASYG